MNVCFSDRSRKFVALAAGSVLLGSLVSCATTDGTSGGEPGELAVLSAVEIEWDGDATVVGLVGVQDSAYTSFQREDPSRLIVDLASVDAEGLPDRFPSDDDFVTGVTVSRFSTGSDLPMARVEVALAGPADYELVAEEGRLAVRVMPQEMQGDLAGEMVEGDDPWADTETGSLSEAAIDTEEPAPPARTLVGLDIEERDEGTVVHLRADGAIEGPESFTLENPQRIVIDLPGLRNAVPTPKIEAATPNLARVRIGQHDGKVRVVLDAVESEPAASHWLLPTREGLSVAMGAADAAPKGLAKDAFTEAQGAEAEGPAASDGLDEWEVAFDETAPAEMDEPGSGGELGLVAEADALPESREAMAEEPGDSIAEAEAGGLETGEAALNEMLEPGIARVYGVQFDAQLKRDRVVVASDHPLEYHVHLPDSETVVLSLLNAVIEPEATARLAPEPGGPVSLVHAFQQPDVDPPETRVVVKRAPDLEPRITQRGVLLFLDFERAGLAATTPPVLTARETAAAKALATADPRPALPAPPAAPPTAPAALGAEDGAQILSEGGLYEGKNYVGRRISLDFKDADIANLLRLIAEVSDLNIIAGENVSGKVTIRLVEIPWDQALDLILLTKGLGFVRVGSVLRIAPISLLKKEGEARLHERRAKEKLEDLVVKLQPVNYASVGEVAKLVQRLLTPRGTVNTDKRTSTIIMKDISSVIDEATALIKAIDTQTPQVLIEAKIVEANLDFARELGTEFGFGSQPDSDEDDFTIDGIKPITAGGPGGAVHFPYNDANNVVFTNPITSAATGVLNLGAFILNDQANIDFRLAAAESNGEGKVISSPRVVTLDNREALIQQGVAIPFQTFENGDAKLEFIDAVLSLKVTPHITADRSIIMKIQVSRDAPDNTVATPTGSPAIAKNQAKTEALVKDNETLVLGGIYVINKTDRVSRTPFLYKLPVLGWMFRNNLIRDIRKELLIFVTPRIISGPAAGPA